MFDFWIQRRSSTPSGGQPKNLQYSIQNRKSRIARTRMASSDLQQSPTFLAMVICDNVLQDAETRKYYILGTATVTFAPSLPVRQQKLCVYAVLTDVRGKIRLRLRLVYVDPDSKEDQEVMAIGGEVESRDPLAVAELAISLHNLVFPRAGEYRFQLWNDDTLLGERRYTVSLNQPK
jgi:hypothetical protein